MKSFLPWVCVVAATGSSIAQGNNDGLDAYRQGYYAQASASLASEAAHAADPIVDYYMGRMRLYGYGELKNNAMAMRYFKRAAERGFLPAELIMARAALNQNHDPVEALYWFKKAADAHDVSAQMYCAAAYRVGYGASKNADASQRYIIEAAKNGNALAQYTLANTFLASKSTDTKRVGLVWLTKAADQNNLAAMLLLGQIYAEGKIVPADPEKANAWIDTVIQRGYMPALLARGNLALTQADYASAKAWYIKAGDDLALAELYFNEKNPEHDASMGFLWMTKAAQKGSYEAQLQLSQLYQQGRGVEPDEALAKTWLDRANATKEKIIESPETDMARWLSGDAASTLQASGYRLSGIFNAWQNTHAREENHYNQPPQMEGMSRSALYKPQFVMTTPNAIPLIDYYDALVQSLSPVSKQELNLPRYPLTEKEVTPRLTEKAILGDSTAQFQLGQLYQQGVSVNKSAEEATKYYAKAAAQQDLRAEYNLGIMYLEGDTGKPDYRQAVGWLNDAAFKGSPEAQYVLGQIAEHGFSDASGIEVLPVDHEQALSMYYLGAANHNGLSQYRLAELLARERGPELTVVEKQKRDGLMKTLYQAAVKNGVRAAQLPLAFFQAMSSDLTEQSIAFQVASKEAEENNTQAALLLGLLYDRGMGVAASHSDALSWYSKAGKNTVTSFILGTYLAESGDTSDLEKGRGLLNQAAESGFTYAPLNLAILEQQQGRDFLPRLLQAQALKNKTASLLLADYYLTKGSDANQMKQARDIYQQWAEKGDKEGQLKLGYMFEQGLGGAVDLAQAVTWYEQSAALGNAVAQYRLGRLNQLGWLTKQPDYAVAKKWYAASLSNYTPAAVALGFIHDTVDDNYQLARQYYELAANQGDAVGQFNLGLLYEDGKGTLVQMDKAAELYRAAAEKGHVQSMVQLAGLYLKGSLGKRDEAQALALYQKAAEKGDRDAQYQMGLLFETGVGVALDYSQAVHFYQSSAGKGNAKAMLALARLYQYGIGLPKNNEEAATLYKELATMGNAYAAYQLAALSYEGALGEQNKHQATQWLQQAVDNGSPQASRALQWLKAQADERISFIEPIEFYASFTEEAPAQMYLGVLSEWNEGNEDSSRILLSQLLKTYPNYAPAQEVYQRLQGQAVWDQSRL
jgi:enhanced entry protein EnhC